MTTQNNNQGNFMRDLDVVKQIDRYIKGDLTSKEIDKLWEAFIEYPEYLELMEVELNLRDHFQSGINNPENSSEPDGKESDSFREKAYLLLSVNSTWYMAAAAAILLAIGVQWFALNEKDVLYSHVISEIEFSEMIAADVQRSAGQAAAEIDVMINMGLEAARSGRIDESQDIFAEVLASEPDPRQKARAALNLGIIHYNKGDYELAAEQFSVAVEQDDMPDFLIEKAWWYLGNAFVNLEDFSQARNAVFEAYRLDGAYKRPALALLQQLDLMLGIVASD